MEIGQFQTLFATLDSLEMVAGDVIDEIASIRAELKQTFEEIEQVNDRRIAV